MRYYRIEIGTGANQLVFTSLVNGKFDPNALDIEVDIFSYPFATVDGGGTDVKSFVKIYGVPLQMVAQATNLNFLPIRVYGGMSKGFPLATAAANQQGLLAQGMIWPAVGNWIGVQTSLDLFLANATGDTFGSPSYSGVAGQTTAALAPANIAQKWVKGTPLSSLIRSVLTTNFASANINTDNMSPNLVLNYDVAFVYGTLQQFAAFVLSISKKIIPASNYPGVQIAQTGDHIIAYDGTGNASSFIKKIQYQDMIGQPTWYGQATNFKTVMRGDIAMGDISSLPPAIAIVTPLAAAQPRNTVAFAGSYMIQRVHHVGRYRQPDAASWCTIFDAVTAMPPASYQFGQGSFNAIY